MGSEERILLRNVLSAMDCRNHHYRGCFDSRNSVLALLRRTGEKEIENGQLKIEN